MPDVDTCPVCDRECESEYSAVEGDRWTDVLIYYCDPCYRRFQYYPSTQHDSLALDRAIEDRMYPDG